MRQLLICLLAISILPLMNNSPYQASTSLTTTVTSSTLTSYSTYTIGMTQFTSTSVNKIYDGNLLLPGWTSAGCGFIAFPFNANPGDQLTVSFTSNVPLDFYLMSIYQIQRVPIPTALCNYYNSLPIFSGIKYISYQTSYSTSWTATDSGKYFIVLFNLQTGQATVSLSAGVAAVQRGASTVYATTATTATVQITGTSTITAQVFSTNQPATSYAITIQRMITLVSLAVIAVIVMILMKRKRQAKSERTRAYS